MQLCRAPVLLPTLPRFCIQYIYIYLYNMHTRRLELRWASGWDSTCAAPMFVIAGRRWARRATMDLCAENPKADHNAILPSTTSYGGLSGRQGFQAPRSPWACSGRTAKGPTERRLYHGRMGDTWRGMLQWPTAAPPHTLTLGPH